MYLHFFHEKKSRVSEGLVGGVGWNDVIIDIID